MIDTAARIRQLREAKFDLEVAQKEVKRIRVEIENACYALRTAECKEEQAIMNEIGSLRNEMAEAESKIEAIRFFIEQLCI